MRYWPVLLLLASTGCAPQGTYENSKHLFAGNRPVPRHQGDWVPPERLYFHEIPSREEVHKVCNDTRVGAKGSHYNKLGMHWASIQDRGCYIYDREKSVGHVMYLAHDTQALAHERQHHYYGPDHIGTRSLRTSREMNPWDTMKTGTRIITTYGNTDR
jgi:hypothetical protein